jgi:8-oxo-dGTP pyrophosphatase MutT (NUDIX family)
LPISRVPLNVEESIIKLSYIVKPMSERRSRKERSLRRVQYAALPYRANGKSDLKVMLVTSRATRRWIIPKGWPVNGMPPHRVAAKEAFEEAGVVGKVSKRPIGTFPYDKVLKGGATTNCYVHVFALRVKRQHKRWLEKRERQVDWYTPAEAALFVQEPQLRRIIRRFAKRH